MRKVRRFALLKRNIKFSYIHGCRGYKSRDHEIPTLPFDPGVRHRIRAPSVLPKPKFETVSLGAHVHGACLPRPATDDCDNAVRGASHRFGRRALPFSVALMRRFRNFVRVFLRAHFTPIDPNVVPSDPKDLVEEWLAKTHYNEQRKNELRKCFQLWINNQGQGNLEDPNEFYNRILSDPSCPCVAVKGHIKRENYDTYKNARVINSRHDEFKVFSGPYFKMMEDIVYRLELNGHLVFIKHVPVRERPEFIVRHLTYPAALYASTDHTAFEAHFSPAVMRACEMQLYRYLLSELPDAERIGNIFEAALCGRQNIYMHHMFMSVAGRRMSGDMCTSLGNGFTNLMLTLFAASEEGIFADGVVEGDDGLFACAFRFPSEDTFTDLGFELKLKTCHDLCRSSFCGIVFGPQSIDNLIDPAEALATFGWSSSPLRLIPRMHKGLLRAKALSLLYEAPGCPVVKSLALFGLRVTEGTNPLWDPNDAWWNDQVLMGLNRKQTAQLICKPVTMESRGVVQENFGVSVDTQLRIERYLDSLSSIQPLRHECIEGLMHRDWLDYYQRYSETVTVA